jgi:hypothetical protein
VGNVRGVECSTQHRRKPVDGYVHSGEKCNGRCELS